MERSRTFETPENILTGIIQMNKKLGRELTSSDLVGKTQDPGFFVF